MANEHILKVGIAPMEQFKARTMAIARGEFKPSPDEPKIWFSSPEWFAQLLSGKDEALVGVIAKANPGSLTELAETSGRAKSNLSRTLKTMERYGIVYFEKGDGREVAPRVNYSGIS